MPPVGLVLSVAISLSLLMFLALFYHKHLEFKQEKKSRARAIRQKAYTLLEAFEYLIQIDNHLDIQKLVLNRIQDLYQKASDLDPETQLTPFDLEGYKQKISEARQPRKILQGANEVRYMRRQFSIIIKLLTPLVKRGDISQGVMLDYKNHLKVVLLEREIDTHMLDGDKAADSASISAATNCYKIVRKRLMEFDGEYPEKNQRLNEVSNKLDRLLGNPIPSEADDDAALAKALAQEGGVNEFGIPLSFSESKQGRY